MHYIQNDWFTTNWLWVLLFLIGSIVLISYINNRNDLLKKALVSFIIVFIFTLGLGFYSPNFISLNATKISFNEVTPENIKGESPAFFSNFLGAVWDVLSSKINK